MKLWKKILLALVIIFVIIQFIRPAKNQSTEILPTDISKMYGAIPTDVNVILEKACKDCHSNNTVYPWYDHIQPVAWWMDSHIQDGKREINFSDFGNMRIARQYKKLDDCNKEIKQGDMPLDSYLWIHKNAILTDEEKQKLYAYFNSVRDSIKAHYPADSLILPKRPPKPD